MRSRYKIKDLLNNQPFYSSKIKSDKKNDKKISNINLSSELPFFHEEPFINIELSKELPFFPLERKKRPKKRFKILTKRQILENILPYYDNVGIF